MPSKPIPGSTGEVLTCLPSPYAAHAATGLLWLPRFIAKCKYVKEHGALPASYAKNFKRGIDRFLCLHLGIDPAAVERVVLEAGDDAQIERGLALLLPADVRATVAGAEVEPVYSGRGRRRSVAYYIKKIKLWDKNAALEKAMKFHGLYREDNDQTRPVIVNSINYADMHKPKKAA